MSDLMKERIEKLEKARAEAEEHGGADKVARQHERGKLTARERIRLLVDEGSFFEFGLLGRHHAEKPVQSPADGVVTGYGEVGGRRVAIASYDFTVMGGSMGRVGEEKMTRLREMALKWRCPIIWLIDSAGARIGGGGGGAGAHESSPSLFAGSGYLFREQAIMSGVVPQVCAMVGPGAAGTAYIPGLADFVPMVSGTSSMALAGPYLVKAAVGEEISEQDLGGAKVHTKTSGVADLEVESDQACIEKIREYLSFFPSHNREPPPVRKSNDAPGRHTQKLAEIVPDNPRRAFDMKKVIRHIVDDEDFFEIKPNFARNLVTALARFDGRPTGIVANNSMYLGGALDCDSADKAARFVWLCDAFGIPLLFLQDTPGFVVGSKVEQQGIIRHGAKMLHAVSEATVPKVTILVRKAYGAGYFVMCGKAYEPDYIAAWPTAECAVMGPEGMVSIFARKALESAPDPEAMKAQLAGKIRDQIDPFAPAEWGMIDDVIDPGETREVICRALKHSANKTVERPWRKHGVYPV